MFRFRAFRNGVAAVARRFAITRKPIRKVIYGGVLWIGATQLTKDVTVDIPHQWIIDKSGVNIQKFVNDLQESLIPRKLVDEKVEQWKGLMKMDKENLRQLLETSYGNAKVSFFQMMTFFGRLDVSIDKYLQEITDDFKTVMITGNQQVEIMGNLMKYCYYYGKIHQYKTLVDEYDNKNTEVPTEVQEKIQTDLKTFKELNKFIKEHNKDINVTGDSFVRQVINEERISFVTGEVQEEVGCAHCPPCDCPEKYYNKAIYLDAEIYFEARIKGIKQRNADNKQREVNKKEYQEFVANKKLQLDKLVFKST